MFVGREKELLSLNKLYASDSFEFVVIYGRRRVGKTTLINAFLEDKKSIYFMGVESNEKQNLDNFSKSIMQFCREDIPDVSFGSFQAALEYVFQLAENERLVLAIDEYPYVAKSSKSLASTIQMLIDMHKATSKLMLVLCGSSMSYMEDQVLSYKSPLYGRRTAQMKVLPFEYRSVCRFFHNFDHEQLAYIYGFYGGTPQYLQQINEDVGIEDNIKNTYLNPMSMLFEEPENLLKQEVREPTIYNAVISAIAGGATRMSKISSKAGEPTNVCAHYLRNLISLGIVQKEMPYGSAMDNKGIYLIADPMFRFWYRFIPENSSLIMRGATDVVYKRIEPYFNDYMGSVFEEISKQYLWEKMIAGECPVLFSSIGRWWGNDPVNKRQEEIDIMAVQDKDTALFGECKWTNEPIDKQVLETLERRSQLFSYKHTILYLFAKNGFTKGCIASAKEKENVFLVGYDDMMRWFTSDLK